MDTLIAHLRLSTTLDGHTRERCPDVVFTTNRETVASLRTDTEQPRLGLADNCFGGILVYDDALSRVIDEEAWLHELQRVLVPDGTLRFTLPKAGGLAWLDAMDAHRYAVDILKRGDAPDAALPTGWNRHYTHDQISLLCVRAGFTPPTFRTLNYAWAEARMTIGLFTRNWVGDDRRAEINLFPQFGGRDPTRRAAPIGTTWSVQTTCMKN